MYILSFVKALPISCLDHKVTWCHACTLVCCSLAVCGEGGAPLTDQLNVTVSFDVELNKDEQWARERFE